MTTENDFRDKFGNLLSYDEWEEHVFLSARAYSVIVPLGRGKIDSKWYATFPEAMIISLHTPRSLLYVSTPTGRAVCIPRKRFEHYLGVYNKATGQALIYPGDPLEERAEREPAPTKSKRKRIHIKQESTK